MIPRTFGSSHSGDHTRQLYVYGAPPRCRSSVNHVFIATPSYVRAGVVRGRLLYGPGTVAPAHGSGCAADMKSIIDPARVGQGVAASRLFVRVVLASESMPHTLSCSTPPWAVAHYSAKSLAFGGPLQFNRTFSFQT